MSKNDKYSEILQDFANPLLNPTDTNEIFLMKIKAAELIWNYCISAEFELPVFDMYHQALVLQNESFPEMKQGFDFMIHMKKEAFPQYENYLITVEQRTNIEGNITLYVESMPPSQFKKYYNT